MADVFDMIAVQRTTVADLLDGLDESQWDIPSLCEGWTVRVVAGHMTMPFSIGVTALVWRVVKARGNVERVIDDFAVTQASKNTAALVTIIRENAAHRFTPPGFGPEAPLADAVVHGWDIGIPVGDVPSVPDAHAAAVLSFVVSRKAQRGFVPKRVTTGLRFVCTDLDWTWGDGPEVSGPARALILAITGRPAGVEDLTGDGVPALAARLR